MANDQQGSNQGLAAIYLRDRSDTLTATIPAIESQRKVIRKWAAKQGLEIYGEYVDSGFSANNLNRPGFQQVLRDAEAGRFQTILVNSMDRFTRDLRELVNALGDLERHGVGFVAVHDGVDTNDGDYFWKCWPRWPNGKGN